METKKEKKPKPAGWGKTLKPDKIQAMKKAWLIHRNDSTVSKLLTVSKVTIRKYKKLGNWQALADKADEKVNQAIVEKASKNTIDNINIIEDVKNWIYITLKKLYESNSFEPTVGDLDKALRLIEFLKGNPDSRPDSSVTLNQVVNNLSDKTADELRGMLNDGERKYKTLGKETNGPVNRLRDSGIVSPDNT